MDAVGSAAGCAHIEPQSRVTQSIHGKEKQKLRDMRKLNLQFMRVAVRSAAVDNPLELHNGFIVAQKPRSGWIAGDGHFSPFMETRRPTRAPARTATKSSAAASIARLQLCLILTPIWEPFQHKSLNCYTLDAIECKALTL